MTSAIEGLEPQLLWKHFAALSRIPRGSKNEAAAARYVLDTARQLGLQARQDAAGNVVVEKPATAGRERAPSVCLQSHLDMVCEKNADKVHDFTKDPIELVREGNVLRANGTTLGADNGIGVATALAVVEDRSWSTGRWSALHDRRGDRPHRGAAPRARLRPEPHPAQPRLGGGGRDLRRLRGGPGHPGDLEGRARGREAEHGRAGAERDGPAGRPLGPGDRQGPGERDEDPQSRPAGAGRGGRRPPGVDQRREQAQRHPARGLRDRLRPEVAREEGAQARRAVAVDRARGAGVGRAGPPGERGRGRGCAPRDPEAQAPEADPADDLGPAARRDRR